MFYANLLTPKVKAKTNLSLLFITVFSFVGNSQDVNQPSALQDYGDHHPAVFIIAIFLGVGILVGVVAYYFQKANKKQEEEADARMRASGFSKPGQKAGKGHDRRYGTKKTVDGGGFSRR